MTVRIGSLRHRAVMWLFATFPRYMGARYQVRRIRVRNDFDQHVEVRGVESL